MTKPTLILSLIACFCLWQTTLQAQKNRKNLPVSPFGSSGKDAARAVIANKTGGFAVVGTTQSRLFGDDDDILLQQTDTSGKWTTQWAAIGGKGNQMGNSLVQTRDGSYVIVGMTDQNGGRDGYVVRVNEIGLSDTGFPPKEIVLGGNSDDTLNDVVEDPLTGDLWCVGTKGRELWMVRISADLKQVEEFTHKLEPFSLAGKAMAWSPDFKTLMVVGEQNKDAQQALLVVPFTVSTRDFGLEDTISDAYGSDIIGDGTGNFGIVGTTTERNTKHDMLFVMADKRGKMGAKMTWGDPRKPEEGYGVAMDLSGNFLVVGELLPEGKYFTDACLYKINAQTRQRLDSVVVGSTDSDEFRAVTISAYGQGVLVGKTFGKLYRGKFKSDASAAIYPPSVNYSSKNLARLQVQAGRFHSADGGAFYRRGQRGFYTFEIENKGDEDLFELTGEVQVVKGKGASVGKFNNLHFGNLRPNEKKYITVPFPVKNKLDDSLWVFKIDFFNQKQATNVSRTFEVRLRDSLFAKIDVASTFPKQFTKGKNHPFNLILHNSGDTAAAHVRVFFKDAFPSGVQFGFDDPIPSNARADKESYELRSLAAGDSVVIPMHCEVGGFYTAAAISMNYFVNLNRQGLGKEYRFSTRVEREDTVILTPIVSIKSRFYLNETVEMTVKLRNDGNVTLKNFWVKPIYAMPSQSLTADKEIDMLEVGKEVEQVFRFVCRQKFDGDSSSFPIRMSVKYPQNTTYQSFGEPVQSVILQRPTPKDPLVLRWIQPLDEDSLTITKPICPELRLLVESNDPLSREKNVTIFINGTNIELAKFQTVHWETATRESRYAFKYELSFTPSVNLGKNRFRVEVKSAAAERVKNMVITYTNPPTLRTLCIGVNYNRTSSKVGKLSYTDEDANALAKAFDAQNNKSHRIFEKVVPKTLQYTDETTGKAIKNAIKDIVATCQPNDVLIISFSGHGSIPSVNDSTFWFWGSDFNDLERDRDTYVDFAEDIEPIIRKKGIQAFLFADACRSVLPKGTVPTADDNQASEALSKLLSSKKTLRALLSCRPAQSSWECPQKEHGVFTQAILEALANLEVYGDGGVLCRAEPNVGLDNVLTLRELWEFLEKRVPYLIKIDCKNDNPQQPEMIDAIKNADLPLFWIGN